MRGAHATAAVLVPSLWIRGTVSRGIHLGVVRSRVRMASDRRFSGFAELHFRESAHLALARAAEAVQTEVEAQHPGAFIVDDLRLDVSIDARGTPHHIDALRRMLEALVKDAVSGEVAIEVEGGERWARRVTENSEARKLEPAAQVSGPVSSEDSDRPTIRTEAG